LITISTLKRSFPGRCTLRVGSSGEGVFDPSSVLSGCSVESDADDGAEVITSTVPVPPCVSRVGAAFAGVVRFGGGAPPIRSAVTEGGKLTGFGGGGPAGGSEEDLGAPMTRLRPVGRAFAPGFSSSESSISSLDKLARLSLPILLTGGGVLDTSRSAVLFGVSAMSIVLSSYLNLINFART